jgi:predicted phosphodiesterase
MAARFTSNDLLQEALNALHIHGSEVAASAALKIPRGTLQNRLRNARDRGIKPMGVSPDDPALLKQQIKTLKSDLKTATAQSSEATAIKQIIGVLDEKVRDVESPEWTSAPLLKPSSPGVPTLFLSDLHWGEVVHPSQIGGVNKYNLSIAHSRLNYCVETAIHLLRILDGRMDYPGIVVPLGGDMISGDIHDELKTTNELPTMPTVLDLYSHLIGAIERLAEVFGHVFLPCVTGNHGRNTMKIYAKNRQHTSFDWLLFQFLARHFAKDKRITFYIPDGSDALYKVHNTRYLLTHGDQFRGGDSIIGPLGPLTRGNQKKQARNQAINQEYDVMICGHWHQYIHLSRLIVNGSLKGYDEYAYNGNFGFEEPAQALWITHPKHGITYRMPVYVQQKADGRRKTDWVSVAGGK